MFKSRCIQLPIHRLTEAQNFIRSLKISTEQVSIQKKNRLAVPYNINWKKETLDYQLDPLKSGL